MEHMNIDKDQLGQLIRLKAHFIDMYMKCEGRNKEIEELFNQLAGYMNEWKRRGYDLGPDKIWANDIMDKCKTWLNDSSKLDVNSSAKLVFSNSGINDVIKNRRSIRFWKRESVPYEVLNKIIEAGTYAPSSFNRMTWRFYVVENKLENIVKGDSSNKSMIEKAPVRIYIAIDERLYEETFAPAMDAALAAQNILLSAHSSGLGACLLYQCELINQEKIKQALSIPEYYKIYCAVLLGYPDELPEIPGRIDIKDVTNFIKVENKLKTFLE